jgi:hypothetical protein
MLEGPHILTEMSVHDHLSQMRLADGVSLSAAGSANVWTMMSADEALGYVYLPFGTPSNDRAHIKNETPKKARGDRRQEWRASIAKFRTRRPAHVCETSRYRAVFERPSYVTRWRRTGWLGRQDSNLCISDRNSPRLSAWAAGFEPLHIEIV